MRDHSVRLEQESAFFDRFYADIDDAYDLAVFARYRDLSRRRLYSKEYRIDALGDLTGKRVIDIGCGPGENAVLLALLGAEVTGIDVSPVAIAKARSLASSAGVEGRCTFEVQSFESFEEGSGQFDVIWVDAFLHHMLPVFDDALDALVRLCAPGARLVIAEPVRTSRVVHALRRFFPAADATPDERPLDRRELGAMHARIDFVDTCRFNGVARLTRFVLTDDSYERASPRRRLVADWLARIDRTVLSLPIIGEMLGGTLVIIGTPRRDDPVQL